MIRIRNAKTEDAERLLEIYDYYVRNTAVTFEYETPSPEAFRDRMKHTMTFYPYLVIERDGRIEGYAYAGAFKDRAAYDWACETTIYLDHDVRGSGLGKALYEALEERLKRMGILNMYACIGYPQEEDEYLTKNSVQFHEHLGFRTVGMFHRCGYKFDRWYDMIWMEKIIGEHGKGQKAVRNDRRSDEDTIQIKECPETDIDRTGRFYDSVVEWLDRHVNYPRWVYRVYPSERSVREMTAKKRQYVCLQKDRIIGAFTLSDEPQGNFQKGQWKQELAEGSYLVLGALAVDPDVWRRNIGSQIISYSIRLAQEKGYRAVRADIVPENVPARRLFEKNGFTYAGDADLELGIEDIPLFSLYEMNW